MINNKYYAIKSIPTSLFPKNSFYNLFFDEVEILNKFQKYDLILKIILAFHDYENLFLVTKLYEGNFLEEKNKFWNESQIQFFCACIIQSLSYLRKEKIIHRDLHFGNILFDNEKYINLIDFHLAIDYKNKDDNFSLVPTYCAPEIKNHSIYDYNSDYYSLGCMIYYIIFKSDFEDKKNQQKRVSINPKSTNYSNHLIDFVNRLLIINPRHRIGYENIDELKNHNFFNNFSWDSLNKRVLKSPFQKSTKYFNKTERLQEIINLYKNNSFIEILNKYNSSNIELGNKIFHFWKHIIKKYK